MRPGHATGPYDVPGRPTAGSQEPLTAARQARMAMNPRRSGVTATPRRGLLRDEQGQIMPLLMVTLTSLLIVGVLLFQVARATDQRSRAQTAADAAALAGARDIRSQLEALAVNGIISIAALDRARARAAAEGYAQRNNGHVTNFELLGDRRPRRGHDERPARCGGKARRRRGQARRREGARELQRRELRRRGSRGSRGPAPARAPPRRAAAGASPTTTGTTWTSRSRTCRSRTTSSRSAASCSATASRSARTRRSARSGRMRRTAFTTSTATAARST